jgi:hypothetical protein
MKKVVSKVKPKSLASLVDSINWTAINVVRGSYARLNPNSVVITCCESSKEKGIIDTIRVRIGHDVLVKLGWEPKDKILPFFNPDDQYHFRLVKSTGGNGYSLGQETNSLTCKVQFKWTGNVPLEAVHSRKIKFEVYKKQLIFRASKYHVLED